MVGVFNRHADDLVAQLDAAAADGTPVDVQALFRRFTIDSFGDAFFGVDLGTLNKPSEFARHFDFLQSFFAWRFRLDPWWRILPTPPQVHRSLTYVNTFLHGLIAAARKDPLLEERTDLLAAYIRSTDDTGEPFTDKYLRDMLLNFLLAGRDTTASLLTWLVYCLSGRDDVEGKLLEEIARVVGMDADPEPEHLPELRYMKAVWEG